MKDSNVRQIRFVIALCDLGENTEGNATKAAIAAGYPPDSARQQGSRLLSYDYIQAAIKKREEELASAAGINPQWVLDQWRKIAEADPNEISQIRRVNCRCCYGISHKPQWTEREYESALNASLDSNGKIPFPELAGGLGFNKIREPNPECPECRGEGEENVLLTDSRKLSGAARRLYAGVKVTQHGIEIKMRDQDAAIANISKYLGMLIDRKEIAGPGGSPIPVGVSARDLTDDQLAAIIARSQAAATS
jgi:phage terminase small subunit